MQHLHCYPYVITITRLAVWSVTTTAGPTATQPTGAQPRVFTCISNCPP